MLVEGGDVCVCVFAALFCGECICEEELVSVCVFPFYLFVLLGVFSPLG